MARHWKILFALIVIFAPQCAHADSGAIDQIGAFQKKLIELNRDLIDLMDVAAITPMGNLYTTFTGFRKIGRRADDIDESLTGKFNKNKPLSLMKGDEKRWACLSLAASAIKYNSLSTLDTLATFSQSSGSVGVDYFEEERHRALGRTIACK